MARPILTRKGTQSHKSNAGREQDAARSLEPFISANPRSRDPAPRKVHKVQILPPQPTSRTEGIIGERANGVVQEGCAVRDRPLPPGPHRRAAPAAIERTNRWKFGTVVAEIVVEALAAGCMSAAAVRLGTDGSFSRQRTPASRGRDGHC